MDIRHKLAVVTGGGRGLGRAIVLALAEAGALPVVHYHQSGEEAVALAARLGGHAVQADLTRPEGASALAASVRALGGELAVWVNNASLLERAPFLDSDDELWQRTLQLTLLSPVVCARAIAPLLVPGGLIVNVLDVAAHQPWRGYAHHCVAKAALHMLTRSLAVELAPAIRVCGVTPGVIGPLEEHSPWRPLVQRIPLGREGAPEDVGRAVRFLVESDYVTGTVIAVDGGLTPRTLATP